MRLTTTQESLVRALGWFPRNTWAMAVKTPDGTILGAIVNYAEGVGLVTLAILADEVGRAAFAKGPIDLNALVPAADPDGTLHLCDGVGYHCRKLHKLPPDRDVCATPECGTTATRRSPSHQNRHYCEGCAPPDSVPLPVSLGSATADIDSRPKMV